VDDKQLRKKVIRLAYENPELRSDLLPLIIRSARDYRTRWEREMAQEKAEQAKRPWHHGQRFRHPETGNLVAFDSLPKKEQKKLNKERKQKQKQIKKDVKRQRKEDKARAKARAKKSHI
jgi:hypothetical protein